MKIAILSVSSKGYDLSFKIRELLKNDSTIIKCDIYHKNVKNNFKLLFNEYDAIIAIMASGILIRSISNLIQSKTTDPAILNIDDNGNFVISMLSGHLGGANKLTGKIANLINATPVVTTSTDVNRKLGIDVLANDLHLTITDKKEILFFNKSILNNDNISITLNEDYEYLLKYLNDTELKMNYTLCYSDEIKSNEIKFECNNHSVILKPKKIVFGIGCKRGKSKDEILKALNQVLNDLNIDLSRIDYLASAEIKNNEKGILKLSDDLNIPVNFVSMDKLKLFKSDDVTESEFVKSKFGIGSVCEASSLITAGYDSKLIYKKTVFNGVTISVASSYK